MKIKVLAGDWANRYVTENEKELVFSDKATVADILQSLPIPAAEVGLTAVNGRAADRRFALNDGDVVKLYPVIVGG